MCQVPISATLARSGSFFSGEKFSIQVWIKRESFELIKFIGLRVLGLAVAVGPVTGSQARSKASAGVRSGPLTNSVCWKCRMSSMEMRPVEVRMMSWTLPMRQMYHKAVCPCLTSLHYRWWGYSANAKQRELARKSDTELHGVERQTHQWRGGGYKRAGQHGKWLCWWWEEKAHELLTPLAPPPFPTWRSVGYFSPYPPWQILWGYVTLMPWIQPVMSTLAPLKSPATVEHVKGLLLLTKTQHQPYIIIVFQGGPITPLGLLQELHMRNALAHIPIFWSDGN